ncbi:MAG: hydrogenase expression/formation protein HypE [Candidatus Omnitrophica bacterium]|nr:hydrogenase expression/formation protein HypE [Candidatus Omnitrophota bacterium]MDE2009648.1 hydrogenase expression/formation protein HypE [Candidatus Omnitrophota bacterium]
MHALSCPFPIRQYPQVLLAHGGGGKLMQDLINKMFTHAFGPRPESGLHDSTVLDLPVHKIAFTTDSFVVKPLFFPGGDIGTLAVNGTVNDLSMSGARPLYLSLSFIIEEGLSMESLWMVVRSVKKAADEAGVKIVTGDTKVVDRGKGDGLFINTSGIGIIEHGLSIVPANIREDDAVLINGDIGRHGIAIMAKREGLDFETTIESDCCALNGVVESLIKAGIKVHCMRDLTRGGVASALNEIAKDAYKAVEIDEASVPVDEQVASACAIMGFDPLYVANEGRFIAFVPESQSSNALEILQAHPLGRGACRIGRVLPENGGLVTLKSVIGARRILDMISGEQLPRIC